MKSVQEIDEIRNIVRDYLKYYGITLRNDKNVLLDDLDPIYHRGLLTGNKYLILTCNARWDNTNLKWYYLNTGYATMIILYDTGNIKFRNAVSGTKDTEITWVESGTFSSTGLNLPTLSSYANNAAAIAGGLVAGDLYRTGGDPDVVCIVH